MDSRWTASFGVYGEGWQSRPTELAEKLSGRWLSHVNKPLVLAASFGRGSPAHVPNVLLYACFLCYPPVKKAKGQRSSQVLMLELLKPEATMFCLSLRCSATLNNNTGLLTKNECNGPFIKYCLICNITAVMQCIATLLQPQHIHLFLFTSSALLHVYKQVAFIINSLHMSDFRHVLKCPIS